MNKHNNKAINAFGLRLPLGGGLTAALAQGKLADVILNSQDFGWRETARDGMNTTIRTRANAQYHILASSMIIIICIIYPYPILLYATNAIPAHASNTPICNA